MCFFLTIFSKKADKQAVQMGPLQWLHLGEKIKQLKDFTSRGAEFNCYVVIEREVHMWSS